MLSFFDGASFVLKNRVIKTRKMGIVATIPTKMDAILQEPEI
jgi:hypothetical protein